MELKFPSGAITMHAAALLATSFEGYDGVHTNHRLACGDEGVVLPFQIISRLLQKSAEGAFTTQEESR